MMMADVINPILQWLNTHPNSAGLATFLISAGESIAIIGTIVPGTVVMTAVGALAGAGVIPLWSTLVWAILGAIIGDNLSYFIGRHFKDGLRQSWIFKTYPNLLNSGEVFFRKYGILSVFIGRFIGPVRALVPLVAGMLGMRPLSYVTVSVIASICWAPVYMLPGILLGEATLEFPPDVAVHALLVLLLGVLFVIFCLWTGYKLFVLVRDQINNFLTKLWQRLKRSRYFNVFTTVLKHHNESKTHGQLTLAFYFIICSVAFAYLALYVMYHLSQDVTINLVIFHLFRSWRTPVTDNIMLYITLMGDKSVVIPSVIVLAIMLAWKKRWNTAAHALVLLVITAGSIFSFKKMIHSMRPWGIFNSPETFSFPSGHTTLATTFYVALGLLLVHVSKVKYKRTLYVFLGLLIFTISVSRLYLGAHWFTDVLGAWLLSASLLMLTALSFNRHHEKKINAPSMFLVMMLSVLLFTSFQYFRHFDELKMDYAQMEWPTYTIPLESWWEHKEVEHMPLFRIGRVGMRAEVFNLQWIGDLDNIKASLIKQGWEVPPDQNWITVVHRVSDVSSAEHLPLVAPLYHDKRPALVLIKHSPDKRLIVLRLWSSNVKLQGTTEPLWVGSIGLAPRTYSWLINYKNPALPITPALVFANPYADYDVKEVNVSIHLRRKHRWQLQPMILIKPKNIS